MAAKSHKTALSPWPEILLFHTCCQDIVDLWSLVLSNWSNMPPSMHNQIAFSQQSCGKFYCQDGRLCTFHFHWKMSAHLNMAFHTSQIALQMQIRFPLISMSAFMFHCIAHCPGNKPILKRSLYPTLLCLYRENVFNWRWPQLFQIYSRQGALDSFACPDWSKISIFSHNRKMSNIFYMSSLRMIPWLLESIKSDWGASFWGARGK